MQIEIQDTLVRDIQAYMTNKGIATDLTQYINTLLLEGLSFKKFEQFVVLKGRHVPQSHVEDAVEQAEEIKPATEEKPKKDKPIQLVEFRPEDEVEKPKPTARRKPGVKITKK